MCGPVPICHALGVQTELDMLERMIELVSDDYFY